MNRPNLDTPRAQLAAAQKLYGHLPLPEAAKAAAAAYGLAFWRAFPAGGDAPPSPEARANAEDAYWIARAIGVSVSALDEAAHRAQRQADMGRAPEAASPGCPTPGGQI